MLIRLFVFVLHESLRELVHEIGGHAHDFRFIHSLLDFAIVCSRILGDVPLEVLVLGLHLNIVGRLSWGSPIRLSMFLLRILVAFLDFGLLKEYSSDHNVFVEESLNLFRIHREQCLQQ